MAHRIVTASPLVPGGAGVGGPGAVAAAARRVAAANREAASMSADDARRIFALRAHEALEGGRAAILTPDRRRGLMRLGRLLGLKPFDASLVIAIVQDGARRGERPDDEDRGSLLGAVRPRRAAAAGAEHTVAMALSIVLAVAMLALLIRWVAG